MLWLARKLRDLSCYVYRWTGHYLNYQEGCMGNCGKEHGPLQ